MAITTAKENFVNDFFNLIKAKLKTSFCDIYLEFLDDKIEKLSK